MIGDKNPISSAVRQIKTNVSEATAFLSVLSFEKQHSVPTDVFSLKAGHRL